MPLLEAPSISIISRCVPLLTETHEEHLLQGSPLCGSSQSMILASSRAVVVLPQPRGPEKR